MVTPAISLTVGVLLFSALALWWTRLDSDSPDALLLRRLRRAGSDFSAVHEIEFYLWFPGNSSAREVSEQLSQDGFTPELQDGSEGHPWVIVARQSIVPEERQLTVLRDRLRTHAEAHGGEYGGWSSSPVPSPRVAALKVGAVVVTLVLLGHAIAFTNHEGWLTVWFIGFIFLGIPLLIVTTEDFAYACKTAPSPSSALTALAWILAVPQALFALLTIAICLSIVAWVLYNTLVERQPEYTGGLLTFGIAPVALVGGAVWIRRMLARRNQSAGPDSSNSA